MKKLKIFITLVFIVCTGSTPYILSQSDENLINREDNDAIAIDFIIDSLNKVAGQGTFTEKGQKIYISDYSKINDLNKEKLLEITEPYKDRFNIEELNSKIIDANING